MSKVFMATMNPWPSLPRTLAAGMRILEDQFARRTGVDPHLALALAEREPRRAFSSAMVRAIS